MTLIELDGQPFDHAVSPNETAASAFPALRDRVLKSGRIVMSVRIGTDEVTWNDGSRTWNQPLCERNRLVVASELPFRVTEPLLARLIESMPTFGEAHRQLADALRSNAAECRAKAAELLSVWADIQQAVEQVYTLHGIDSTTRDWRPTGDRFRALNRKLNSSFQEMKESLELGDQILAADLMEFELAPLAEEWAKPLDALRSELGRRCPAA